MSDAPAPGEDLEACLQQAAADSPYPAEAFLLVLLSLPQRQQHEPPQHLEAAQLCWRIRARAIEDYGADAGRQLAEWSIHSCDDFGDIVYRLIDAGLMAKSERDAREDFHDVFRFETAFDIPAAGRPVGLLQWRLSTMLVVTTLAAIAFAGLARAGMAGAVGTVLAVWFAVIGLYCLVPSVRNRERGWKLAALVGLGFTTAAVVLFLSVILH
jgi:uncharacterized repeat protein (TIGR04138 family)